MSFENEIDYDKYLRTDYWKEIKEKVHERDGYRCRLCNSDNKLHVHHRTYEYLGNENLDELITLCNSCHYKFHQNNPGTNRKTHKRNKKIDKANKEIKNINEFILNNHKELDLIRVRLDKEKYIRACDFIKVVKKINKKYNYELFFNCCLDYVRGVAINYWHEDYKEMYNLPKRSVRIILDEDIYNLDTGSFVKFHIISKLLIDI